MKDGRREERKKKDGQIDRCIDID
jgi:hypothetical protein